MLLAATGPVLLEDVRLHEKLGQVIIIEHEDVGDAAHMSVAAVSVMMCFV